MASGRGQCQSIFFNFCRMQACILGIWRVSECVVLSVCGVINREQWTFINKLIVKKGRLDCASCWYYGCIFILTWPVFAHYIIDGYISRDVRRNVENGEFKRQLSGILHEVFPGARDIKVEVHIPRH